MTTEQTQPKTVHIEVLSRSGRYGVDEQGRTWPFVTYLDAGFHDCTESEGIYVMVGSRELGYTIVTLANYERKTKH